MNSSLGIGLYAQLAVTWSMHIGCDPESLAAGWKLAMNKTLQADRKAVQNIWICLT